MSVEVLKTLEVNVLGEIESTVSPNPSKVWKTAIKKYSKSGMLYTPRKTWLLIMPQEEKLGPRKALSERVSILLKEHI